MMMTILAATDFSRSAALAVRRAARLARTGGARFELMHVLPSEPIPASWTAIRDMFGLDSDRVRTDAMSRLRQAAGEIDAEPALPVELHLANGNAHTAIAARASAIGADLVVVGAHGEHFMLDLFIGTTAQRVQRRSPAPVLVVRQAPLDRYQKVLIATDFSPASAAAARAARAFFPGAAFHVLHVFDVPFESLLGHVGADDAAVETYRRQAGDHALLELETFVRELNPEGDTASIKVRHGYAPTRIKERAAELDADVIALGTHGKSWIEIGLLGSVSEHVTAESSSDILLVRPPPGTPPQARWAEPQGATARRAPRP